MPDMLSIQHSKASGDLDHSWRFILSLGPRLSLVDTEGRARTRGLGTNGLGQNNAA